MGSSWAGGAGPARCRRSELGRVGLEGRASSSSFRGYVVIDEVLRYREGSNVSLAPLTLSSLTLSSQNSILVRAEF